MPPKKPNENELLRKYSPMIRKAWNSGKKTVELGDKKFSIVKQTKFIAVKINGAVTRKKEQWLVATPADGSLLPVMSVELKEGANLRSK